MEVGLTPDQIVGAAAIVRAIAGNKRVMIQIGGSDKKQPRIYKDGEWMGHDANRSELDVAPTFKYSPETFPKPARSLRMMTTKKQRSTGTEMVAMLQTATGPSRPAGIPIGRSGGTSQMMTPFTFATGARESSESPQPPPLIDGVEEARREEEELRRCREEMQERRLRRQE